MKLALCMAVLCLGFVVANTSVVRAQEEAVAQGDATAEAAAIGAVLGGVLGAGVVYALYQATDPDHGGESSVSEGQAKASVMLIGLPIIFGTAALGALLGSTAVYVATDEEVVPVAAISPDGGYLGARLTF